MVQKIIRYTLQQKIENTMKILMNIKQETFFY